MNCRGFLKTLSVVCPVLFAILGCNSATTSNTTSPEQEQRVTLKVADRADLDSLIAKHKGNVVLVDYWASWCGPCRKMFPHTVMLSKKHQTAGLKVISVSLDDEDAREEVQKFLTEQNATFDNLLSKGGGDDASFESFEIPSGALPCLRLFDRDGKLVKTFAIDLDADKQFTDADIAAAVNQLLKVTQATAN